jgi:hypothetical protein
LQYPVLFPDDWPVRSSFVSLLNKKNSHDVMFNSSRLESCYCVKIRKLICIKIRKLIRIKIRKLISNNIEINKYYGFSLSLYWPIRWSYSRSESERHIVMKGGLSCRPSILPRARQNPARCKSGPP